MYTYLLINFFTFLGAFVVAIILEKKVGYLKNFRYLLPAIFLSSIIMLIWDHYFTKNGIWGFSSEYITGIKIFELPIEEILFFYCIPFATVFIYEAYNKVIKKPLPNEFAVTLAVCVIIISFTIALLNVEKAYTFTTFTLLSLIMLISIIIDMKIRFLGKFFVMYFISIVPFFVVNTILTHGLRNISDNPVVWYNNSENLNFRMGTIPIEDAFYSMLMLVLVVIFFEIFKRVWNNPNSFEK